MLLNPDRNPPASAAGRFKYFMVTSRSNLDLKEVARCEANCAVFFEWKETKDFLQETVKLGGKLPKVYEVEIIVNEISPGDRP
jgi:hypothetical protein